VRCLPNGYPGADSKLLVASRCPGARVTANIREHSRVIEASERCWTASDGVELAYHEMGEGRPVILLHGLFSDARMNWIKFGHAERIAREGFRVIMPDLRAHGQSGKPHGQDFYPRGILARDLRELVALLGLDDFDLGGFSLGARTTVEAVGEGMRPRRAVLGGAGLDGLRNWKRRKTFFVDAIAMFDTVQRGDPHWLSIQFMKSQGVDRVAAARLLESFEDAFVAWLEAFTMPTLVVCGSEDDDNGSAEELANVLPNAIFEEVPGTHMSSVTKPQLAEAIAAFLAR
jgi:pimeloyl-ACP methyl ester carboxylesterase